MSHDKNIPQKMLRGGGGEEEEKEKKKVQEEEEQEEEKEVKELEEEDEELDWDWEEDWEEEEKEEEEYDVNKNAFVRQMRMRTLVTYVLRKNKYDDNRVFRMCFSDQGIKLDVVFDPITTDFYENTLKLSVPFGYSFADNSNVNFTLNFVWIALFYGTIEMAVNIINGWCEKQKPLVLLRDSHAHTPLHYIAGELKSQWRVKIGWFLFVFCLWPTTGMHKDVGAVILSMVSDIVQEQFKGMVNMKITRTGNTALHVAIIRGLYKKFPARE